MTQCSYILTTWEAVRRRMLICHELAARLGVRRPKSQTGNPGSAPFLASPVSFR